MRVNSIISPVPVEVECDGYIPLVVRFGGYKGPTVFLPKYWRTGDFKHTLIEIGVNPSSGAICKIVFTALNLLQSKIILTNEGVTKTGVPCAALEQWENSTERVDVKNDVIGSLANRELTVIFCNLLPRNLEKIQCERIIFLIDHNTDLCGIQIMGLSDQEFENIRNSTSLMTI